MKNKKLFVLLFSVFYILTNCFNVFAYVDVNMDFENGTEGWILKGSTDVPLTEYVDDKHKNSMVIDSPGKLITYVKTLGNPVTTDNGVYVLSYDVLIPKIKNASTKQTVLVLGQGSNGVAAFYGLRIDNGVVAYPNGIGKDTISTATKGDEPFTITENEWHTMKTVYDRASGLFTYFVDDEPLRNSKGDILKVRVWNNVINYKIAQLVVSSRNISSDDKIYVDNISIRKVSKTADSKYAEIYNLNLKNSSGTEVDPDNISKVSALKATFDYNATKNFNVVAAFYKNNSLSDVVTKPVDVSNGAFNSYAEFDLANSNGADSVRFYAWDKLENISPLKCMKKSDTQNSVSINLDSVSKATEDITVSAEGCSTETKSSVKGISLKEPLMSSDPDLDHKKKYDSTSGGPEKKYYINLSVENESFLNRYDGTNYNVEVTYYDEGYGCFTLEYDSLYESFKEAEYVELNDTKQWKTYTFNLQDAVFAGEGPHLRLATWGEIMRYSITPVLFSKVSINMPGTRNQFIIKSIDTNSTSTNPTGNIFYTGDTLSFSTTVSNRDFYDYSNAFGTYKATLKYTLLDENKNEVKTLSQKEITIKPTSVTSADILNFTMDKYGLYYLKTEVICDKYSLHGTKITEFSYVHSDKGVTVNKDFGTTLQSVDGEAELVKNAGIGYYRSVKGMKDVMSVTYDSSGSSIKRKAWKTDWTTKDQSILDSGMGILNCLLGTGIIYSSERKNGYPLYVPYGKTGRGYFAEYCKYFAENAPPDANYYEIWNEFDSPAGTQFNMNGEDYSNYGNLLVKAADAIYSVDKDAIIVSGVTSHARTHEKTIIRVAAIYGLNIDSNNNTHIDTSVANRTDVAPVISKYFTKASVHPYHWNDNPLSCESLVTGEKQTMYEHLMDVRNTYDRATLKDTKLWVTELAWSPHFTDYNRAGKYPENVNIIADPSKSIRKPITEKQQGNYLVQSYVMLKKNDLVEKYITYLFMRQTNVRVDRDKNMGIVKYARDNLCDVPLAATSAYLTISNFNMLMADAKYVADFVYDSGTAVAYRYKRSNGEDIAILWSALEEGEKVSLNLGCKSITLYDEYGNTSKMTSNTGIYNLELNQSTKYITGNFTNFKK